MTSATQERVGYLIAGIGAALVAVAGVMYLWKLL